MAIPLNQFKTSTAALAPAKDNSLRTGGFFADSDVVYSTPSGITSIVLMAQAANIDSAQSHFVTLQHFDTTSGVTTELVRNFEVLPNDAAGLITGKLIVEETNQIKCFTSDPAAENQIQFTFSFLESLNG